MDAAHTVTGTVDGAANSLTFTVNGNMTMRAPSAIMADMVAAPAIKTELTLKDGSGKEVTGGTVTKAEMITSGTDAGKLEIAITLPEGYSVNAKAATVNYVANSTNTAINMASASSANGVYTTKSTATTTVIGDGSGVLKIELVLTDATVSYSGAVVAGDTDTASSLALKGGSATALKFKLDASEIPAYAKELKVTYTLSGTTNDGQYSETTTDGKITGSAAGSINANGPVTVTIDKVEASKVDVNVTSDVDGVSGSSADASTGVSVGETALGNITLNGLAANAKSVDVTYTITGAESVSGSKLTDNCDSDHHRQLEFWQHHHSEWWQRQV